MVLRSSGPNTPIYVAVYWGRSYGASVLYYLLTFGPSYLGALASGIRTPEFQFLGLLGWGLSQVV